MNMIKEKALSFYMKSIPYLEVAILAARQKDNKLFHTHDYQDVVNSLFYHSVELFLKFAILMKCKNIHEFEDTIKKFTHDINALYETYRKLYTEDIFDVNHPFDIDTEKYVGEKYLLAQHTKKYPVKFLSQNFRYPIDKKANFTNGAYSFNIDEKFLNKFKLKIEKIFSRIYKNIN